MSIKSHRVSFQDGGEVRERSRMAPGSGRNERDWSSRVRPGQTKSNRSNRLRAARGEVSGTVLKAGITKVTLVTIMDSLAPARSALVGLWLRPDGTPALPSVSHAGIIALATSKPFAGGLFTPVQSALRPSLPQILFATSQVAQIPSGTSPIIFLITCGFFVQLSPTKSELYPANVPTVADATASRAGYNQI
jgi:hypothetical protein